MGAKTVQTGIKTIALVCLTVAVWTVGLDAETYMRANIDPWTVEVVPCGPFTCVRAQGWAVTDQRQERDIPTVTWFIGPVGHAHNATFGWGPAEMTQRSDVCPIVGAWWGWLCGAVRTYDSLTQDWWGKSPSQTDTPWVGVKTTTAGVVINPSLQHGCGYSLQLALNTRPPIGIQPVEEWSNEVPFCW